MTKMLLKFILVGLLCASGLATAQNIRVNVPFQFYVGGTQMPAGAYLVQRAGVIGDSRFMISEVNGGTDKLLFGGNAVESRGRLQESSKIVFACYDNQCFLSEVWNANDDRGVQLIRTASEKKLIVARKSMPNQVILAALK